MYQKDILVLLHSRKVAYLPGYSLTGHFIADYYEATILLSFQHYLPVGLERLNPPFRFQDSSTLTIWRKTNNNLHYIF